MNTLLFLTTLLLVSSGAAAFNVLGYANVQYSILYNEYLNQNFSSYPFLGYPLQSEWINLNPLHSFTNGFFSGIFWNIFENNATYKLLQTATNLMLPLAPVAFVTGSHDIGFVIMSSFGHAYRLLQKPEYLEIIVNTAITLSERYSPIVRCTRSWDSKEGFLVIIDNMMNLEVLFEAANQTNNQTLYNMAWQHTNRTMFEHFRADNSTFHVIEYNETDGSVIRKYTAQGYADWSTWSRGQAWSVHGFTTAYRYTKYQPFLDKAIGAANYFLSRLTSSSDMVPYWDFDAPGNSSIPYQPRDTSAAAIFTSGLVELSQYVTDATLKDKFLSSAKAIIDQLTTPSYLILGNKDYVLRAVMANGTQGPYPSAHYDVATVFGDYYLTEAILRLSKLGYNF